MEKINRSRRQFLAAIVAAIAGILLLYRYLLPKSKSPARKLVLAKAEIPVQGALVYKQARIAVVRDRGEVYALDLVCTHLGCTVSATPAGFICPCHGSRFDRRGMVDKGPADRPLKRYKVQVNTDDITVYLS